MSRKQRTVRQRHPAASEQRDILRKVPPTAEDPKSVLLDVPEAGDDRDFERPRELSRPVDLSLRSAR